MDWYQSVVFKVKNTSWSLLSLASLHKFSCDNPVHQVTCIFNHFSYSDTSVTFSWIWGIPHLGQQMCPSTRWLACSVSHVLSPINFCVLQIVCSTVHKNVNQHVQFKHLHLCNSIHHSLSHLYSMRVLRFLENCSWCFYSSGMCVWCCVNRWSESDAFAQSTGIQLPVDAASYNRKMVSPSVFTLFTFLQLSVVPHSWQKFV